MDRLDEQLKIALARDEPPLGFADRVIAASQPRRPTLPYRALAAGLVLFLAGGAAAWRHHQGEAAKAQVLAAVRITAGKLHHIQSRVREVTR